MYLIVKTHFVLCVLLSISISTLADPWNTKYMMIIIMIMIMRHHVA